MAKFFFRGAIKQVRRRYIAKQMTKRANVMKRLMMLTVMVLTLGGLHAQQVSSRAKAMRMMSFGRPEYQIKDIKVYTDTMTVYSLSSQVIYPLGVWESMEQYITDNQLHWYRESDYKRYFDAWTTAMWICSTPSGPRRSSCLRAASTMPRWSLPTAYMWV